MDTAEHQIELKEPQFICSFDTWEIIRDILTINKRSHYFDQKSFSNLLIAITSNRQCRNLFPKFYNIEYNINRYKGIIKAATDRNFDLLYYLQRKKYNIYINRLYFEEESTAIEPTSDFDMESIIFYNYKKENNNLSTVKVGVLRYNGIQPLIIKTPEVISFSVNEPDEYHENGSLSVSLNDYNKDGLVKEFYTFMTNFYQKMVHTVCENKDTWTPRMKSFSDSIEACCRMSPITPKKKHGYPPYFTVRVPFSKDKKMLTVIKKKCKHYKYEHLFGCSKEEIKFQTRTKILAECNKLYICDNHTCCMPWTALKCELYPDSLYSFFDSDSDSDSD